MDEDAKNDSSGAPESQPSDAAVPDVSGLKKTLTDLRGKLEGAREREAQERAAKEAQESRLQELESALAKATNEAKAKDLGVSGEEFERVVQERAASLVEETRTKLQGVIEKREADLKAFQDQLQTMKQRSHTATLQRELGRVGADRIHIEALDEITRHAMKAFTVGEDESIAPSDPNALDDNGKAPTLSTWLDSLAAQRPYLFRASGGSGSAGSANTKSIGSPSGDPSKWSFEQKQKYQKEHNLSPEDWGRLVAQRSAA